ncbi:nuclease-related domain-containing protein [Streptomyces sp. NPDC049879]|uniref:nuclease-related domain-containing protein n=1 Tax=Streptomyces sp. NPDC049879 TaxID=3365598 RepID=UPI003797BA38
MDLVSFLLDHPGLTLALLLILVVAGTLGDKQSHRRGRRTRRRPAGPRRYRSPVRRYASPTASRIPDTAEELLAQQARLAAGATGEKRTARVLDGMGPGWSAVHRRALPHGRADLDHVVVTPSGTVIHVDSKMWSSKHGNVYARGARLLHGDKDVTSRVEATRYESGQAADALGVPVGTVVAMHGARVTGGQVRLPGVLIVPGAQLRALLREIEASWGPPDPERARYMAEQVARLLPPYADRHGF